MLKRPWHRWMLQLQPYLPLISLCLRLLLLLSLLGLLLLLATGPSAIHPWNTWRRLATQRPGHPLEGDQILNKDPNYPWIRSWLRDHIYYSFYDGTYVYDNQDSVNGQVSRRPHHDEELMFSEVLNTALRYLNSKFLDRYHQQHCTSVRYRTVPTVGLEVDVTCRTPGGAAQRVTLLQEFSPPHLTFHHTFSNITVNLVMPLRGRLRALQIFLENLKNVLRDDAFQLGLTIVYFDDPDSQRVRQLLQEAEGQIPSLQTEFILLENLEFSRGRGLQEGVERSKLKGEVAFFCDVDVLFTREFLTRCQTTPVRGYQVFTPIVFSQYNPQFLHPLRLQRQVKDDPRIQRQVKDDPRLQRQVKDDPRLQRQVKDDPRLQRQVKDDPRLQRQVKDDLGYWRLWGHGMVCLFKSDFSKLGTFSKKSGWGGEDLEFLKKIVKQGDYKVIRSLDPGLYHLYHAKRCDKAHNSLTCSVVRAASEASKTSLGLWYFKHTNKNASIYDAMAAQIPTLRHDDYDHNTYDEAEARGGQQEVETRGPFGILLAVALFIFVFCDMILIVCRYITERRDMSNKIAP